MIRVEGLRKSFGDVRAVDGVDLQVERGDVLVLLGQNGAGKSTTLRCLGGILRPDAGLIELDGLRLPEPTRLAHQAAAGEDVVARGAGRRHLV